VVQQVDGILVPELNELKRIEYLVVDNPQVVIDSLIEDHVVDQRVDLFPGFPKSADSMNVDVLKYPVCLRPDWQLLDNLPQELDHLRVVVENTEEKAVEYTHGVLLDVGWVFGDAVNDL